MMPEQEQETQVKKFLHIALLLLLGGNFCFALEAKFSEEHACVPAGEHVASCAIRLGKDTLSRFAFNSDSSIKTLVKLNPEIVNPDLIIAGHSIIVPDGLPQRSIVIATAKTATTKRVMPTLATTAPIQSMLESQAQAIASVDIVLPITMAMEDSSSTLSSRIAFSYESPTFTSVASEESSPAPPTPPSPPTSAEMAEAKEAKITGYQFVLTGSNLQGQLATQLILFNNEDEKVHGLPCENCRINLKPSTAFAAKDGMTIISVPLKTFPQKPFVLLVAGINVPIDDTQIKSYRGKTPGSHPYLRAMVTLSKMGAQAGISLVATGGNPAIAAGVVAGPRILNLVRGAVLKTKANKITIAQAAIDKSQLDLYHAKLAATQAVAAQQNMIATTGSTALPQETK